MFSQSFEMIDQELYVTTECGNFSIHDGEDYNNEHLNFIDAKALRIMQKMGYKNGSGLGKNEQGVTKALDFTYCVGKQGLGLVQNEAENSNVPNEEIFIKENVKWLHNTNLEDNQYSLENMTTWIKEDIPNHNIQNEINFCDRDVLQNVLEGKNIFDELNLAELCRARTKANPFETIRSVFFMNRAALKMANIDAATGFMFSAIDQNVYHKKHIGPYYFADVCAGPGGFTEYILWRRKWLFKGFGMTLKDENDFKLYDSVCASPITFQAVYGKQNDGNVCCPENIQDFKQKVLYATDGEGVHFMTSDGGFSVEGNENIQEILSKKIYICQCLVALEVIRVHGHFVTKLFDIFTPFSVGLLFLMYKCFEKVSIFKPNSSRPANSERYFICSNLKRSPIIENIRTYLWTVVRRLWEVKDISDIDILEIVPLKVIKEDINFHSYIINSNNSLGKRQVIGLKKLEIFCRNPSLIETRQEDLRKKCLEFWKIPDIARTRQPLMTIDELLNTMIPKPEVLFVDAREIDSAEIFRMTISDPADWHYCPMYSSRTSNRCNFYAGIGTSKVYRLQGSKWVKIKNLQLVRGTLLYGEFVKEKCVQLDEKESCKYSLHVIDALRLGETSLADMRFEERVDLIHIYCKAVNREFTTNSIRIRPKVLNKLSTVSSESLKTEGGLNYISSLPLIGYNMLSEIFHVNSLLLLKTNNDQSFFTTYVLRVQISIASSKDEEADKHISWENLLDQVKLK